MLSRKRRLIALGVLTGVMTFAAAHAAAREEVQWFDNYAAAMREADRTGKPVFLEFRCEP